MSKLFMQSYLYKQFLFTASGSTIRYKEAGYSNKLKYFQGNQYKSDSRIDGKVVIVTGCNTGLGKETALELAKRGGKIYMACLNPDEGETARLEIIKNSGNPKVYNHQLNLASLQSVRNFVAEFLKEESYLDILINNAGLMTPTRCVTEDDIEMTFGVNYVGHFLLTNLLLQSLGKSAQGRIITISSVMHKYGKINKSDINSKKSFNSVLSYAQSKLAVLLFTRHLAKLLSLQKSKVTINAVHPGICQTQIFHNTILPSLLIWILTPLLWIFLKTPKSGAQTTISLAVDPKWENTTGQYMKDCEVIKLSRGVPDNETTEWLWNYTKQITKLK